MHRRNFIRLIGGGAVFAATAGLSACAEAPDPTTAWVSPGSSQRDVRFYALAHAILAPNPHNRQPWLARLDGDDQLSLFVDRTRLLPATDPFGRQIVIGCGAFLELLSIAASIKGYQAQVLPFPDGQPERSFDQRPFARVTFVKGGAADPLFRYILRRRTSRDPFADQKIPRADLAALEAAGLAPGLRTGSVSGGPGLEGLKDMTKRAFHREVDTPAANQETVDLIRIGAHEVAEHRDGISLTGAPMEAMKAVGILTRENLAKPGTIAFKQNRSFCDPLCDSARAFVWIVSQGEGRMLELASGRAYARMTLEATARHVALQPMSQALQEYPEMAPLFAESLRRTAVQPGERLQMLVRAGYAAEGPPAPRRGLAAHLRAA